MTINVLHVNYDDQQGGSAIAVNRIHEAQKKIGINSKILVAKLTSNNVDFIGPSSTTEEIKYKIFESINRKLLNLEKKVNYDSNSYNFLQNNILNKINDSKYDIINLHWIGNSFIKIKDLKKINKPIVWTLHDMWPYCGSEHYTISERYIEGYKKSNKSKNHKGLDIEKYCWNQKLKHYPYKMHVIAPSNWQYLNASNSKLFSDKNYNFKIHKIKLPLDFNFWKPIEKNYARKILGLKENLKIILIGSADLNKKRKGYLDLNKILRQRSELNNLKDLVLLSFGKSELEFKQKYINFKNISPNSHDLKLIYSASDVYLAPSLQESFGQTALEALSCLTPVVCFNGTGITDLIKHKKTGYLANLNDFDDFYEGILWVLDNMSNKIDLDDLAEIEKNYSEQKIAKQYLDLYSEILKSNS